MFTLCGMYAWTSRKTDLFLERLPLYPQKNMAWLWKENFPFVFIDNTLFQHLSQVMSMEAKSNERIKTVKHEWFIEVTIIYLVNFQWLSQGEV